MNEGVKFRNISTRSFQRRFQRRVARHSNLDIAEKIGIQITYTQGFPGGSLGRSRYSMPALYNYPHPTDNRACKSRNKTFFLRSTDRRTGCLLRFAADSVGFSRSSPVVVFLHAHMIILLFFCFPPLSLPRIVKFSVPEGVENSRHRPAARSALLPLPDGEDICRGT